MQRLNRPTTVLIAALALLALVSARAVAQPATQGATAGSPPQPQSMGMSGEGSMMGGGMGMGGMGGMGGMSGMGMGGMGTGMPMMQMMQQDPKLRGRMMELQGEMMRTMGDAMIQRGKELQKGK